MSNMSNKTDYYRTSPVVDPISGNSNKTECHDFFGKRGRAIIIVACVLIAIGYFLMSGQGNTLEAFNPDIFSTTRIVVAPILCLAGYLLVIVGILQKK